MFTTSRTPDNYRHKLGAGVLLCRLTAVFSIVFASAAAWLAVDQHALLENMEDLQSRTLPNSMEHQRLARNLEVLRLEGERVLAADNPENRRQALFIVTLMAGHPSLLANEKARNLAIETEIFLTRAAQGSAIDENIRDEWTRISRHLSLTADDISVDGINLAREDVRQMNGLVEQTRQKLHGAVALVLGFLALLLLLIRRMILRPLQQIDHALSDLRQPGSAVTLPNYSLRELASVREAIVQLHGLMQEHESTRDDLQKLAATDVLTSLNNRRHFMFLAESELTRAQRYGRPISIGLADLDHFKHINDIHGHAAGDLALKAFADIIRSTLRHSDIAGRYGGEEFAFVFPETTPQEAVALAERLRAHLDAWVIPLKNGGHIRLTTSIGIADASAQALEDALRLADEALYQAKASGRNRTIQAKTTQLPLPLGGHTDNSGHSA
ncbi:MAG: GGDEF domain-containing protein [Betaproteobacteria bacterium]|nr:GGDEF domain-containing protein [Betaproteobacteria bacterium]